MTNRSESSTKTGRVFVNEELCADCREVWLNRERATAPKVAPGIQSTVYPEPTEAMKHIVPIHVQLSEIH
jgi:hypothetical protein